MANILLGTLRDYWKGVYDAIATGGLPKKDTGMQIAGSDGAKAHIIKTNSDGELQVASKMADIIFHDEAIDASNGEMFAVGNYKTITLEVYGTSTSRIVVFMGRGLSGTSREIMGVKLSDLSTATSTTGTGELWQFDVTGLISFCADLQAVSGGSVSVKGRAVA